MENSRGNFLIKIGLYIISFLYIFGTNIPILNIDISVFINLLLLIYLPVKLYGKYIISSHIFLLFSLLFLDLIVCILIPIFHLTYDFSIIGVKVNFLITLFNLYQLSLYVFYRGITLKYISNLLVTLLLIQSLLIVISLLNNDIGLVISSLSKKTESVERMIEAYGGARGLGWANYSAFGLAIVYGSLLLILFYSYEKKFISKTKFYITLLVSIIATTSVGRTAYLGLILCLLPMFRNAKNLAYLSIITITIFLFLSFFVNYNIDQVDNLALKKLYIYAFEPINNYVNMGSFKTNSTSHLIDDMYFPLTNLQFLIGDGIYTNNMGKYYLNTDAGYMRFVLYYGILFSILLYINFLKFTVSIFYKVRSSRPSATLVLSFIIMSFIFHYKGEVVLFAHGFNKVIFIYLFYFSLNNKKK